MKCRHDVLRNGYYTGRRCSRDATMIVTYTVYEIDKVHAMCTQHAQMVLSRNKSATAEPVPS